MNHDGILDLMDWRGQMPEQGVTSALHNIKDIIYSQHIMADDVIKRMNLRRNQPALNRAQLATALNLIDFNLNYDKAM